jgi:hypothetical protein
MTIPRMSAISQPLVKPSASHNASNMCVEKLRKNAIRRRPESLGWGTMASMHRERICCVASCKGAPVTELDHQALCLNHFLLRCYDKLEGLDPRGRRFCSETLDAPAMRAFIEECSRKALDVSLHSDDLTNLQRGRLLDILLWASELFLLLRAPRLSLAESMASSDSSALVRVASHI